MKLRKILLLGILTMSACMHLTNADGSHHFLTPKPLFIRNLPKGEDSYSFGFRSGCNDSMGLNGYGMMRLHEVTWGDSLLHPLKYQYQYDANRALDDDQYGLGYGHGFSYCGTAANAVVGF